MEEHLERSLQFIEQSGWLAPLFFILLHVFRQVLFIPVLLVCLVGGYLFGTVYGSLYSMIGLTAVSLVFYALVHLFPSMRKRLTSLKQRFLKGTTSFNSPANDDHAYHSICSLSPHILVFNRNHKEFKELYS